MEMLRRLYPEEAAFGAEMSDAMGVLRTEGGDSVKAGRVKKAPPNSGRLLPRTKRTKQKPKPRNASLDHLTDALLWLAYRATTMILRRIDFKKYGVSVVPDLTELKEEVCIDLHVGDSFLEAGSSAAYPFDKAYSLEAGACIIVRTKEVISLPNNVFGTLCAKGSLAALGFLVPNTKVDPMFFGELDIALFNAGKRPLNVENGKAFCSIVFHKLEGSISSNSARSGIRVVELKQQKLRPLLRTINKHMEHWRGFYALLAALLAIGYGLLKLLGKTP